MQLLWEGRSLVFSRKGDILIRQQKTESQGGPFQKRKAREGGVT